MVQESHRECDMKMYLLAECYSDVTEEQRGSGEGRIPRKKKVEDLVSFSNFLKLHTFLQTFVGILHSFKYIKNRYVFSITKIYK